MVTGLRIAVFCDIALFSLVDIEGGLEVVSSSETSVSIYQTTQCYIPEDGHFIREPSFVSDFHKTHPYVISGSVDQTVKVWECR
jgi:WD40 repeat protein